MIDFHAHIFPDRIAERTIQKLTHGEDLGAFTNGTEKALRESMEMSGVDLSILLPVATKPSQFQSINRYAMNFREEKGLLSFGGIHPDSEDIKGELRILKENGFLGIKLHPDYQQTYIDDIKNKRLIDYASELGLIISVHSGFDPAYPETHCTVDRLIRMVDDVKPEKLVIAHMGCNLMWDEVERDLVGIDAWFDTGVVFRDNWIGDERFIRIARKQGVDRILFATDSPWADQQSFVEHFRALPMTDEEKHMITHVNAENLLGMRISER